MVALATIAELKNNLDWDLDPEEERVALADLEHASNLVITYGLPWTAFNVPPLVKTIVIQAARRHVVNMHGLIQSRAGDETLVYPDLEGQAGTVFLTDAEIKLLHAFRGGAGFGSIGTTAWSPPSGRKRRSGVGYVPTGGGGAPHPWINYDEDDPW